MLVTVLGGLVVVRPGLRELSPGRLSQLVATVLFALRYILAERLSMLIPASSIVALLSVTVTPRLFPPAFFDWQPVRRDQLAWLVGVAVLAAGGLSTMARAFWA